MSAPPNSGPLTITGAARGIGAATAAAGAAEGRRVVLMARDDAAVARQAQALGRDGAECLALACDVSDEQQVQRAFAEARDRWGPPSGLVTCAGIDRGGLAHELDSGTWDEVIAVNLRGAFLACREAVRAMLGRGGAIVCVSSPFALVAAGAVTAYGSSKAGVGALVRSLAVDYAAHGI